MLKTPYDVSGWIIYLEIIDDSLSEVLLQFSKAKNQERLVTLAGRENVRVGDWETLQTNLLAIRKFVGQRCTQLLPGSYKLWRNHLLFLQRHETPSKVISEFHRCLSQRLHKMPRLWMDFLGYIQQHSFSDITFWRHTLNHALEALPVTQHSRIWADAVVPFIESNLEKLPPDTSLRLLRRYTLLDPTYRVKLAELCTTTLNRAKEACDLYLQVLNDPTTPSTSRPELWMEFSELCCKHPNEVEVDFEALVRTALSRSNSIEEVKEDDDEASPPNATTSLGELEGALWAKLATYFTSKGDFDMARSIYEEALDKISRVRDFSILFDAYLQLEEGILEASMQLVNDDDEEEEQAEEEDDMGILLGKSSNSALADMEFALARAEHLTARRPLLLNRVLLTQNPHNIGEWLERAKLYSKQNQNNMAVAALRESLRKVHANKAINGAPSSLVLELAKLLPPSEARDLFDKVCLKGDLYKFRDVEDLANCYCAWVELELAQEQWDEALSIARQAVVPVSGSGGGKTTKAQRLLCRNAKVWDLLLDLEESLGTVQSTKDAYNQAMSTKVATPHHILQFASFLREQKYFEESFAVYERGVEMFAFPHPGAKLLWKSYLEKFLDRYGGQEVKVERTRDLLDRCLEGCPPEEASAFFLTQGQFEEQYGLTKRALSVYRKMCHVVPEKYTAYQLYIAKTTKYMGVTATREIYQEAIGKLDDEDAASKLCMEFAKMETSFQELDRARKILAYGSQMADPRKNPEFWTAWHEFEVAHGNEETFRDMLRIKRSVEASFSTVNYNAVETSNDALSSEDAFRMIANQEGVDFEGKDSSSNTGGFVKESAAPSTANETKKRPRLEDVENQVAKLRKVTAAAASAAAANDDDDDEIDIDDDDDDGASNLPIQNVSQKAIPSGVYGGLASKAKQ